MRTSRAERRASRALEKAKSSDASGQQVAAISLDLVQGSANAQEDGSQAPKSSHRTPTPPGSTVHSPSNSQLQHDSDFDNNSSSSSDSESLSATSTLSNARRGSNSSAKGTSPFDASHPKGGAENGENFQQEESIESSDSSVVFLKEEKREEQADDVKHLAAFKILYAQPEVRRHLGEDFYVSDIEEEVEE